MDEKQLKKIEETLNLKLPANYRDISLNFPFFPTGYDGVYWFFDTPQEVINETLDPLVDGQYNKHNWKPTYLAIGNSAGGDVYLLDTELENSPVFYLSHEDHAIEEETSNLQTFILEWKTAQKELQIINEEHEKTLKRTRKEQAAALILIAASILVIIIMVIIGMLRR